MSNLNSQFTGGAFQILDLFRNVLRVNTQVPNLTTSANTFQHEYLSFGGGPFSLILPTSPVFMVYLRNLDSALGGVAPLLAFLTPQFGAPGSPIIIQPGGVFIYWHPFTTNPTFGGLTQVQVDSTSGFGVVETLLVGLDTL